MAEGAGKYDYALQMWREDSYFNFGQLAFMRWLADNDRLEHPAAGPVPQDGSLAACVAEHVRRGGR